MAGVNGRGCQRTCTYRPNAAVAERSVTSHSGKPGRAEPVLSVPALTSRIAVYGPVCTVVWEGGAARLLIVRLLMTRGGTSNLHQIVYRRISSEIEPVGGNGVLVPLQPNAGHGGDM